MEESFGYAPLTGLWRGGHGDDSGGLYLWGESGFTELNLEQRPAWLLSDTALSSEALSAALSNVEPSSLDRAVAWTSDTSLSQPPAMIPEEAVDLLSQDLVISIERSTLPESFIENRELWLIAYLESNDSAIEPMIIQQRINIIPPTTWGENIEPIYLSSCQSCHDGRGGARDLSTPASWASSIEEIIFVTEQQSMPIGLPPLNENEVGSLRQWRNDGFIE